MTPTIEFVGLRLGDSVYVKARYGVGAACSED